MERRQLLTHLGVAAGAGASGLAGVVGYDRRTAAQPESAPVNASRDRPRDGVPSEYADEFETVVDATSAGADPDGEEPINDFLTEHAGDDTLLTFRPGTYRLRPAVLSGFRRFGIVGVGDERPTIAPISSTCRPGDPHLMFESVGEFLLEDVDLDFRVHDAGGSVQLFARDDVTVRNVELVGDCPDQIASMRVDIWEESAVGEVENLVARNPDGDSQLTGVYVGKHHAGDLRFRDCEVRGFSDNGLYASAPGHPDGGNGTVEVIGGTFADNDISNVRLGTTGSVARDVTVTVESPTPLEGSVNARGIRLRERGDHLVENCDVRIGPDVGSSFGALVFHPNAGTAEVRDTRIEIEADRVYGVNALAPSGDGVAGPVFDGLTINGGAAEGYAAVIRGRDETVFRNCTIGQNGYERGGIRLEDAADCRIVDSEITTTGPPVDLVQSNVSIRNTTVATPDGIRSIDSMDASNEVIAP